MIVTTCTYSSVCICIQFCIIFSTRSLVYSSCEENVTSTTSNDSAEIEDLLFTWYTELQSEVEIVDKMVDRFAEVGITVTEKEVCYVHCIIHFPLFMLQKLWGTYMLCDTCQNVTDGFQMITLEDIKGSFPNFI